MSFHRWKWSLIAFVLVLFTDYISKLYILTTMPLAAGVVVPSIPVFEGFLGGIDCSITHTINKGAAWGAFSSYPQVLLILRIIFIAILIAYTAFSAETKYRIPLSMIIGGAIGNVADFFLYGHVIDMIHFRFYTYDYPVFNIADSAICIGTAWIFALLLLEQKRGA